MEGFISFLILFAWIGIGCIVASVIKFEYEGIIFVIIFWPTVLLLTLSWFILDLVLRIITWMRTKQKIKEEE